MLEARFIVSYKVLLSSPFQKYFALMRNIETNKWMISNCSDDDQTKQQELSVMEESRIVWKHRNGLSVHHLSLPWQMA